jgi:glycerol-3-phosphate acyltransferase PlsY
LILIPYFICIIIAANSIQSKQIISEARVILMLPIERFLTNQLNLDPVVRGLLRAAVHSAVGIVSALALLLFSRGWVLLALAIVTIVFLSFDIARLRIPGLNTWFSKWFALVMREEERIKLTHASYFLLGCLLTALVFPKEIASLAILFAALGDPAATVVGTWKGYTRFWEKSMEGSLACLIVCVLVGMVVVIITGKPVLVVAVMGAIFAMVFELLPLRVNDNITVPIGSASIMMIFALLV